MNKKTYSRILLPCLYAFVFITVANNMLTGCKTNKDSANLSTTEYQHDNLTISRGQATFAQNCASCHAINHEGIGPRLGGITTLLPKQKLIDFILNPAVAIEAGDPRFVRLQAKYKTVMPPASMLSKDQISDVLSYVDQQTKALNIEPLIVNTTEPIAPAVKLVDPLRQSKLKIELEDYFKIPRWKDTPRDKGLATLRAHPAANGVLFASDQMGVIYRYDKHKVDTFLLLTANVDHFIYGPGIGTGLGSFAFHPDFLKNGLIYTTHAESYSGKPAINDKAFPDSLGVGLQWVLTEWKLKNSDLESFEGTKREVFRMNAPTIGHGVQDIQFAPVDKNDPDYGMLYMGVGDGGSNNIKMPELADHPRSLLGAILHIDPLGNNSKTGNYGIPKENPFANSTDPLVRKEIWAYGFRNPHRFCWDRGRMITAEIGEANVEEVNIVDKGAHYGWAKLEGNYGIDTKNDLKKVYKLSAAELKFYHAPFGQYDHQDGNAVSGGFVYHGPLTALNDKYIFGDIVSGWLGYMNIDATLSDSTMYEFHIKKNGAPTAMSEILNNRRCYLRIGYDQYSQQLFIMTKSDGMIRKVTKAYYEEQ